MALQDDECWSAVRNRDRSADGLFVFAVRTTGIFCRPSCPARRPNRGNVEFFALWREAEAAGYRPCLRCKPKSRSHAQEQAGMIEVACRMIENRIAEGLRPPKLEELAERTGISKFHLQRQFKQQMGLSPHAFAKAKSDEAMRKRLATGLDVTRAAYDSGLSGPGQFYARALEVLGMTAAAFRQGGLEQRMWLAMADTSLGRIAVAGTEHGVSAVRFGDDDQALREELASMFPKAVWIDAETSMNVIVNRIVRQIEMPEMSAELPLDLQGTVFQQKVWQALREIAVGQCKNYSELARDIGKPESSRAVANACGANPVAVVIPCHRVIRADGSLGGYRWGEERKRALLRREGALEP